MASDNNVSCPFRLKTFLVPAFVSAFVIIDQFTKRLIESSFSLGERVEVIPGFFHLIYIKNSGLAFGLLSQVDSIWIQRGFIAFTLVAVIVIVSLYRSMGPNERMGKISLVMIGTGALGNLGDRVRDGAVTDFLLFFIGPYHWPAFNVADSLITVGVAFLSYAMIFLGAGSKTDSSN